MNKLVTIVDTLDNSKDQFPKFIRSTPLISLDDYENKDGDDNKKIDHDNVTSPEVKDQILANKMIYKKK